MAKINGIVGIRYAKRSGELVGAYYGDASKMAVLVPHYESDNIYFEQLSMFLAAHWRTIHIEMWLDEDMSITYLLSSAPAGYRDLIATVITFIGKDLQNLMAKAFVAVTWSEAKW